MTTPGGRSAGSTTALSIALAVVGVMFVVGVAPLMIWWPAGFAWGHGPSHYLWMIAGIYVTLGVFLLAAARNPLANSSLIWFTIASSVVHAAIMAVQAIDDPAERVHLFGDVPALLIVAIVLTLLMPRASGVRSSDG